MTTRRPILNSKRYAPDDDGAVAGAVVRIQITEHSAVTGSEGKFEPAIPESFSGPVKLTAWAKRDYISEPVES